MSYKVNSKNVDGQVFAVACLGILAILIAWVFLAPLLAMLAWNWAVAPTFDWPTLTYWKTFVILFLISLVTSGFGSASRR